MPITPEERGSIAEPGCGLRVWSLPVVTGLRRVVEPSDGGALEGDPVCVVEEAVEDGVAEGGIADDVVPVLDGDLAGEPEFVEQVEGGLSKHEGRDSFRLWDVPLREAL